MVKNDMCQYTDNPSNIPLPSHHSVMSLFEWLEYINFRPSVDTSQIFSFVVPNIKIKLVPLPVYQMPYLTLVHV